MSLHRKRDRPTEHPFLDHQCQSVIGKIKSDQSFSSSRLCISYFYFFWWVFCLFLFHFISSHLIQVSLAGFFVEFMAQSTFDLSLAQVWLKSLLSLFTEIETNDLE